MDSDNEIKNRSKKLKTNKKTDTKLNNMDNTILKKLNGQLVYNTIGINIKNYDKLIEKFRIKIEIDLISFCLFIIALSLRLYQLDQPKNIVFDELHYGKYVSLYMKRTFFFDPHPPLGKQMIAAVAYLAGFDGNYKFDRIGNTYTDNVPLYALRVVPAVCGSLLIPIVYNIILEIGLSTTTAGLAGLLILCDNALLTQSRFILMESMLLMFSMFGILCVLYFRKQVQVYSLSWFCWLCLAFVSFTCALCIKFAGIYTMLLGIYILIRDFWLTMANPKWTDRMLQMLFVVQIGVATLVSVSVYLIIFYVHLLVLNKAGPHDSVMTSAFQASLEGGLASITKGQPLLISHGSQITLRHTHGRTCWLHSHAHVYPVRYSDKRGSSHQQQVTCYSFKDVNNWWIVKRPEKNDLVVGEQVDTIKHGDVVQLVHGITSRALNAHDVAAPMSPQCQEVSCYIDYNVSMPAQNLWRVDIINKDQFGDEWQTIQSHIRLVHVNSSQALRYTGRQLPDWGFNQHEIVTDKIINQDDTVWNVEEHRYTKTDDQKERERQLVNAEMIPTAATQLSFWSKFEELQRKMLFFSTAANNLGEQSHMYASEPLEWPFMTRGIAYWVSHDSNAQIHLLGNLVLWYSATFSIIIYVVLLLFYVLRRRRHCYDLPDEEQYKQFVFVGELFLIGYLCHFIPYFFVERTLFLHHYLPALIYKLLLMVAVINHCHYLLNSLLKINIITLLYLLGVGGWICSVVHCFLQFIVLSYGLKDLSMNDILELRWKDSWDFIIHRNI